jgi:protein-disulfide isomerase
MRHRGATLSIPSCVGFLAFVTAIYSVGTAGPVYAQDSANNSRTVRDEIASKATQPAPGQESGEMTKDQANAILGELRAIHELLERQANRDRILLVPSEQTPRNDANQHSKVELRAAPHWHSMGQPDATVVLVEFTDYQCPFCRIFHAEILPEIKAKYVDQGKLRFVSLDLPLQEHSMAMKAAEAARCAGDQGKYWELRDMLLKDQATLSDQWILSSAKSLSLDPTSFTKCLDSGKHRVEIQEDGNDAAGLQIASTPTFVLARTTGHDTLVGTVMSGVVPVAIFEAKIEELLVDSRH